MLVEYYVAICADCSNIDANPRTPLPLTFNCCGAVKQKETENYYFWWF